MVVRLNYIAHAAVDNVIFNMYLYWPSGYLCAQLGTGRGTSVPKGPGYIELLCPFVNLRPGMYPVDVSAERPRRSSTGQHRCAILRIDVAPLVLAIRTPLPPRHSLARPEIVSHFNEFHSGRA
jgi:hypothetical protein